MLSGNDVCVSLDPITKEVGCIVASSFGSQWNQIAQLVVKGVLPLGLVARIARVGGGNDRYNAVAWGYTPHRLKMLPQLDFAFEMDIDGATVRT